MEQQDFNIVVTNVFGIAEQAFAQRCRNLLTIISTDSSIPFSAEAAGLDGFNFEPDYQLIIGNGYSSIPTLSQELIGAFQAVDWEIVQSFFSRIPEHPDLFSIMDARTFKKWVDHVANLPEENVFNDFNNYLKGLFGGSADGSNEIIREAIADDNVELLKANESAISGSSIVYDDIKTALMIESIKTFEWLVQKVTLDDEQILEMLEYVSTDDQYFKNIFSILSPTEAVVSKLKARLRETGINQTINF